MGKLLCAVEPTNEASGIFLFFAKERIFLNGDIGVEMRACWVLTYSTFAVTS